MTFNQESGTLRIENIKKVDEGNYTCIAKTEAGIIKATSSITVYIKPLIEAIRNNSVLEGVQEATLSCKATGDPLPSIQWIKAGSKYVAKLERNLKNLICRKSLLFNIKIISVKEENGNFRQLNSVQSSLTIYNPEPSDAGLYKCEATNAAGTASKLAELIVHYSPIFTSESMNVHWSWDQQPVKLFCEGELPLI